MKYSKYQEAIFDFIASKDSNLVIDAKAGSGKTTTTVAGLSHISPDKKVAFVAFNREIAQTLQAKAPDYVQCSTIHSLNFRNLRNSVRGKVEVNRWKVGDIIDTFIKPPERYAKYEEKERHRTLKNQLRSAISMIKNTLTDYNDPKAVINTLDEYGVDIDPTLEHQILGLIPRIIDKGLEIDYEVDFDDMIYMPLVLGMPLEQFDFLAVDEAQDLNSAQIEFILRSINGTGRIMAVGDPSQSIYGWRGADAQAIPKIITATKSEVLPLSICYRCGKNIITLAQTIVPEIEAWEQSPPGLVKDIKEHNLISLLQDQDMILCRTNAPLISLAFSLLAKGMKAIVRGRDIGKRLAEKARKATKGALDLHDVSARLYLMRRKEIEKAELIRRDRARKNKISRIKDEYNCLFAILQGISPSSTPDRFVSACEEIFSDDTHSGIILSSVHRAKGLEAERVFILKPELMPHPLASSEQELQQEMNIKYVAITRAKKELYIVQ